MDRNVLRYNRYNDPLIIYRFVFDYIRFTNDIIWVDHGFHRARMICENSSIHLMLLSTQIALYSPSINKHNSVKLWAFDLCQSVSSQKKCDQSLQLRLYCLRVCSQFFRVWC